MRLIIKISILFLLISAFSCSIHRVQKNRAGDHIIKVMTYNIHHCNPPGRDKVIDVDAIAQVIKEQDADLVALQEVDVNTIRSGKLDEPYLLALKAGYPFYYFGKAMDFDGGKYGVMILSKYLINDTRTFKLPSTNSIKNEPRILAVVQVNLPGGKILEFGSTHLEAFDKNSRILQAREISRIAQTSAIPFLVAGDLNDNEGSDVLHIIENSFTKTCKGCPVTFNEVGTTGAIDFIMYSPKSAFNIVNHRVITEVSASDHFPVVAALKW